MDNANRAPEPHSAKSRIRFEWFGYMGDRPAARLTYLVAFLSSGGTETPARPGLRETECDGNLGASPFDSATGASMLRHIHVRPIDIADSAVAAEILQLQHAAYRIEAELIGSSKIPPLQESLDELRCCGETFLGADLNGSLVGGVSWKLDGDTLDIHRLVVDPRQFRQGIGTTLIRAALAANPGPRA